MRLADNSAGLHVGSLGIALAPVVSRCGGWVEAVSPGETWSSALAHIVKMRDEDTALLFPVTPRSTSPAGCWAPEAGATQLLVMTQGPRRRSGDPELLLLSGRHPDRGSGHGRSRRCLNGSPAGRARRCQSAVNRSAGRVHNVRWQRAAPNRRSGDGCRGADPVRAWGPTRRRRRSCGVSRRAVVRPADGGAAYAAAG